MTGTEYCPDCSRMGDGITSSSLWPCRRHAGDPERYDVVQALCLVVMVGGAVGLVARLATLRILAGW